MTVFYTIYKTTNLLNGKFYIGKHQTENPNDRYFGSGKYLKLAIQKYGKNNFKKEVLYIYNTEQEMNDKEREILTEEFINTDSNYNATVGGEGGPAFKGRKHSQETKEKISLIRAKQTTSIETRRKISEANKRRSFNFGQWKKDNPLYRKTVAG